MSTAALRSPLLGGTERSRCHDSPLAKKAKSGNEEKQNDDPPKAGLKSALFRRCGSCMYFWPFCDVCVCPPPHQYCPKKHAIIRRLEHQNLQLGVTTTQLLEIWDRELTPKEYVKKLVHNCRLTTQE